MDWLDHWRVVATLPDAPLRITGDRGGTMAVAMAQVRPWLFANQAVARPARVVQDPPGDGAGGMRMAAGGAHGRPPCLNTGIGRDARAILARSTDMQPILPSAAAVLCK